MTVTTRAHAMRLPTASIFLLALAGGAQAQQGRQLEPLSRSGEAVTGRITLSADSIRFTGGKSLKLALVDGKARGSFDAARPGTAVTARLYRVVTPADLVLRNGNTLCGRPVTHLVVYEASPGSVHLNFYEGAERPGGQGKDKLCFFSVYGG